MRGRKQWIWAPLLAVVLLGPAASGQVFFGMDHTAQGAARLTATDEGLDISGFGDGGLDGVGIDPGLAEGLSVELDATGALPLGAGSELVLRYARSLSDGASNGASEVLRLANGNPLHEGQTVEAENPLYTESGKAALAARTLHVTLGRGGSSVYTMSFPLPYSGPVLAGPLLDNGKVRFSSLAWNDADGDGYGDKSGGNALRATHHVAMNSIRNIKALPPGGEPVEVNADTIEIAFEYPEGGDCPCAVDALDITGSNLAALRITGESQRFAQADVRSEKFHVRQQFGPAQGERRLSIGPGDGLLAFAFPRENAALAFHGDETTPVLQGDAAQFALQRTGEDLRWYVKKDPLPALGGGEALALQVTPAQELEVHLLLNNEVVASAAIPPETTQPFASGLLQSEGLIVGFGIEPPGAKIAPPHVVSGDSLFMARFAPSAVTLAGGLTAEGDAVLLTCPSGQVRCPSGHCAASASLCPTPGAAGGQCPPGQVLCPSLVCAASSILCPEVGGTSVALLEVSSPLTLTGAEGYSPGGYADDLGLPPSDGGFIQVGESVCFEIPDAAAASVQWSKDGSDLPGATSRRLCLGFVQVEDSGTYRARYDDGSKAPAEYVVTITVGETVPMPWHAALLVMAGLAFLSLRRPWRVKLAEVRGEPAGRPRRS